MTHEGHKNEEKWKFSLSAPLEMYKKTTANMQTDTGV